MCNFLGYPKLNPQCEKFLICTFNLTLASWKKDLFKFGRHLIDHQTYKKGLLLTIVCVWWSLLAQNRFLPQQNGEWTLTAIETFFTKTFSWQFLFLLDIINQFISWIVEIKFGSPEGSLLLWSLFAQWNSQCCKYYKRQESHVWFITGEHSKNAVLRGFH